MKPRLLDLFSGAGGAAMGYHRAGFDVVGVDHEPMPDYPFEFIEDDALEVLGQVVRGSFGPFDAIHASPPCQVNSTLKARWPDHDHPDLIEPVRELLLNTDSPYVIENVEGARAKLIHPTLICGSSLGLDVRRHRLFETNWPLMAPPCAHGQQQPKFDVYEHGRWFKSPVARVYGHGGGKARAEWPRAMGIDWMTHEELAQAIPPAYTELIGYQLVAHLSAERAAA